MPTPPYLRKLTDEAVKAIFLSKAGAREEAARHNVTRATISLVRNRRIYANVTKNLERPGAVPKVEEAVPA